MIVKGESVDGGVISVALRAGLCTGRLEAEGSDAAQLRGLILAEFILFFFIVYRRSQM